MTDCFSCNKSTHCMKNRLSSHLSFTKMIFRIKINRGGNTYKSITAPVDFNPEDHFSKREMRGQSILHTMGTFLAREAVRHAGLVGEDGKLKPDINRGSVA